MYYASCRRIAVVVASSFILACGTEADIDQTEAGVVLDGWETGSEPGGGVQADDETAAATNELVTELIDGYDVADGDDDDEVALADDIQSLLRYSGLAASLGIDDEGETDGVALRHGRHSHGHRHYNAWVWYYLKWMPKVGCRYWNRDCVTRTADSTKVRIEFDDCKSWFTEVNGHIERSVDTGKVDFNLTIIHDTWWGEFSKEMFGIVTKTKDEINGIASYTFTSPRVTIRTVVKYDKIELNHRRCPIAGALGLDIRITKDTGEEEDIDKTITFERPCGNVTISDDP